MMRIPVLLLVILGGCAGSTMTRTELFFGLSKPDGGAITDQEWQAFVEDTITPRFPDGFTIIDGEGQWREASGHISHEHSKILLILHPHDQSSVKKLDEIRAAYKDRFKQEAVIRESSDATVSF